MTTDPSKAGPRKCTWTKGSTAECPHTTDKFCPVPPKICGTILDNIGHTPLVRINRITKNDGIKCEILAKCEFFNSGGSVKDRIGKRMVEDAEKQGRIKLGDTLIEPTSGNTGIGLALAAAVKGYKMIITLPEKMSTEKVDVLKGLGATIVRTPTEAAWDSPESHIGVAERLKNEIPNAHILDQYGNPSNPLAHYDTTAEELVYQTDGKIDYLIATAGTGGTITGLARKLKEKIPDIKVIGVDPHGSILAQPSTLNSEGIHSFLVEGIGYDFIPNVCEQGIVDSWIKTHDREAFVTARRLIKEEGILCGGSSGSAMWAALQFAKTLPADKRVVVILADSVRNYMTKFLSDNWMIANGFMDHPERDEEDNWWSGKTVQSLSLPTPVTITPDCPCKDAIEIMKAQGFDQLPVINTTESKVLGTVTEGNLMAQIMSNRIKAEDRCDKVLYKKFKEIPATATLGELSRILTTHPFALVVTTQKSFKSSSVVEERKVVTGVASRIDLLNFITHGEKNK